ncbi:MAG: ATP-binding protein [Chitinophagaceae bacterium]|nr:ATP-binding protein [Chitinophagaceae bacterium]
MPVQDTEVYIVIVISIVLALMLVGFIVTILYLYQRRQHRQEQELVMLKDQYDRELLRSQLEIQEATLENIAQELHDNIGQIVSVAKISSAILPIESSHPAYDSVLNIKELLTKASADISNLTKSLHTDRIAQIGLLEAIRFEVQTLRKSGLVKVELNVLGDEYSFEQQKEIFLFRMFQEMMNNILKHAKASLVEIDLNYDSDETFIMQIKDDGVGFDVDEKKQSEAGSSGVGLKSLFSRSRLIGADVDIISGPGKGTVITVILPLSGEG